MPTDRAAARPGPMAWPRLRARLRAVGASIDGGFTMVEMMVALIIIAIIMTALGTFFVNTVSATSQQGAKQAAIQLADDGVERVRALQGSAIVVGRDQASSDTQWQNPVVGVAAYQADMSEVYDSTAATGAGTTAALPTTGLASTLNGLTYTQNWYIGACFQPVGGGACGQAATFGYVPFYRVVVAVAWRDKVCANSACSYITATLVSRSGTDPTFISSLSAQPPSIVNPGNQVSDVSVPVSLQLAATGGAGSITWAGTGLPLGLSISVSGLITGTPTTASTFNAAITATDSFNLPGTAAFTWTINTLPTVTNPGTQTDAVNSTVSFTPSLNGGSGSVTWSASGLPAGLSINSSTGTISGSPTGAGTSSVTITGTDSLHQSGSAVFTWVINPLLQITTPADQTTNQNVTITSLAVAAVGGVTPYSWAASGLPTGLAIDSSGVISGKPTVAGVYTVKVTVTDSDGTAVATNNFKWTVVALTVTNPTNNLSSTRSTAITPITATATGGTGTGYTWTVVTGTGNNKLPTGITLTTAGVISGTPSVTGVFTVTIKVTDSAGSADTQAFTWTINTTPNVTAPTANQASTAGMAIVALTATATGGTGDYHWSATNLPAGVGIDADSGVISGTPSAANTYSVTIKVTDDAGSADTQAITWTVAAAPNITTPSTSTLTSTQGRAITSITSVSTGGTGGKTWSASGLPTGVTISATGTISGTPSAAGNYSVAVKVTDALGATDTQLFTWTVNNPVDITNPTGTTISTKKSTAVSLTPAVTGGTGAITWSVTGLPPGLLLSSTTTGKITGTTNATVKKYTVKVTATDSLGATDVVTFTWSVTN